MLSEVEELAQGGPVGLRRPLAAVALQPCYLLAEELHEACVRRGACRLGGRGRRLPAAVVEADDDIVSVHQLRNLFVG